MREEITPGNAYQECIDAAQNNISELNEIISNLTNIGSICFLLEVQTFDEVVPALERKLNELHQYQSQMHEDDQFAKLRKEEVRREEKRNENDTEATIHILSMIFQYFFRNIIGILCETQANMIFFIPNLLKVYFILTGQPLEKIASLIATARKERSNLELLKILKKYFLSINTHQQKRLCSYMNSMLEKWLSTQSGFHILLNSAYIGKRFLIDGKKQSNPWQNAVFSTEKRNPNDILIELNDTNYLQMLEIHTAIPENAVTDSWVRIFYQTIMLLME